MYYYKCLIAKYMYNTPILLMSFTLTINSLTITILMSYRECDK